MYEKIRTSEELPLKGGYYAIETDRIYGHVHWSIEKKVWTLEDGSKMDSITPNYWLKEINQSNFLFKQAFIYKMIQNVNNGAISTGRFTELLNKEVCIFLKKNKGYIGLEKIISTLSIFLFQNEDELKNNLQVKIKEIISILKAESNQKS